jgi:hypothetical protein
MKDLDFDELDRAVNSLITNVPVLNDSTEPKDKTITINAALPRQTFSSQQAAPTVSPLVGQRSGTGRFMDVVHPSSDMRTTLATPERVSRQGTTISPAAGMSVAPVPAPAPVPVVIPPKPTSINSWPNPLAFHGFNNNEAAKKEPVKGKGDDIDQISDDIAKTLNQASGDTPDSPFIPGTKVDKRPLGAFSTEPPATEAESLASKTATQNKKPDTDIGPRLSDADTPFPPELQDDLLLIEASESTAQPVTPNVINTPVVAPVTTAPPAITNVSVMADDQPVGPTSITQQYKEQLSSGDQNTGAIYDTDAYHKPLLQPVKKKSGWLWVMWIVILMVVGAGAGVAVYFFVLPH